MDHPIGRETSACLACPREARCFRWAPSNLVGNFGIAETKTALVVLVFTRIRRSAPIVHVVAAAGLVWHVLLIGLSVGDLIERGV